MKYFFFIALLRLTTQKLRALINHFNTHKVLHGCHDDRAFAAPCLSETQLTVMSITIMMEEDASTVSTWQISQKPGLL